jgi:hypothetical protein
MRHAQTSENSKHANTNRVTNSPNVMLHRAIEIANKFAGCFIAPPIRLGTLTGQYSSRECNSLLCPGLSQHRRANYNAAFYSQFGLRNLVTQK